MKIKKSIVFVFVACVLITATMLGAFAYGNGAEGPQAIEMYQVTPRENVEYQYRGSGDPDTLPYAVGGVIVGDEPEDNTRSVSVSADLDLAVGESWSKTFNTVVWFNDDHDAFRVAVTNVTGTYKIIITDTDGFEYSSPEMTNADYGVTIIHAHSDRDFTVYVVNTGSTKMTGHVRLSSFYNS